MRINEITKGTVPQMLEMLERNCGPYLQEIGGLENALLRYPLYRGTSPVTGIYKRVTVRNDRIPMSTPIKIHNNIDNWFEANSKNHIRYRSASLFCSGSRRLASSYAEDSRGVVIVLPVGEYHYAWARQCADLFEAILALSYEGGSPPDMSTFLPACEYLEDTDLTEAINSGHEIMLHCKEAILINNGFFRSNEILRALKMPVPKPKFTVQDFTRPEQ